MGMPEPPDAAPAVELARRPQQRLLAWLLREAYPLWSAAGVDAKRGAFVEALDQHGVSPGIPCRARVPARQIYAFALAPALGWRGPAASLVERGLHCFITDYRRSDGLFRTLVAADGTVLDDSATLYDQAFALLAFAATQRLMPDDSRWEDAAQALLAAVQRELQREGLGFDSGLPDRTPLQSNPHMHLFEACLAWARVSAQSTWRRVANEIAALALDRFVDPVSGCIHERFAADWLRAREEAARIIEPGHQFEWAWLLLSWADETWSSDRRADAVRAAFRLIEIGESAGVQGGVVVDALWDDLSLHDRGARLWPQTERLKAAALAARITGRDAHWLAAVSAAQGLERYLTTRLPGLWRDRMTPTGAFQVGPAPAGNLYHIVAAIRAFTEALQPDAPPPGFGS
jgi:mannose-6-phosphate isomerase